MAVPYHLRRFNQRQVNPRLGIYYGIFAAAFGGLVMMLVILEQLGYPDYWVRLIMIAAPAAFAAVIGVSASSAIPEDYFISGRRVPALFNGLVVAVTALGATGLLAVTGAFFFIGADANCLVIGYFFGMLLAAVLLVPYLRKMGAYTMPSYLGLRFESRIVRLTAALVMAVPMLLILVAELRVGAALVKSVLGVNRGNLIWPAAMAICMTVLPGGMRSLTWSSAAWALIAVLALLVPASILSATLTNLPLPQLTYGGLLPDLTRLELAQGLNAAPAGAFDFKLPDFGIGRITKPFAEPFGAIGSWSYVLAGLSIMFGSASLPNLLVRAGTTPGVYDARKSMVWAAFYLGIMLLTVPAIAVFARYLALSAIVGRPTDQLPEWLSLMAQAGQMQIDFQAPRITVSGLGFRRDIILLALPSMAGFPPVLGYVAASGIVAAALASASSGLVTLANMASEDVLFPGRRIAARPGQRLLAARTALVLSGTVGAFLALQWTVDPMRLVLWAMSFSASTVFPVLAMSIWWKRINKSGAFFGMLTGFVVTCLCIVLDGGAPSHGLFGFDSALASMIAMPLAAVAAVISSLMTPVQAREIVNDMRVPGGETIYDRQMRLAKDVLPPSRTPVS